MNKIKVRDFKNVLIHNGYHLKSYKGSHAKWTNGSNTISVPMTRDINPMLARRLVKENNLHLN